jgi:hypothetical protein
MKQEIILFIIDKVFMAISYLCVTMATLGSLMLKTAIRFLPEGLTESGDICILDVRDENGRKLTDKFKLFYRFNEGELVGDRGIDKISVFSEIVDSGILLIMYILKSDEKKYAELIESKDITRILKTLIIDIRNNTYIDSSGNKKEILYGFVPFIRELFLKQ